MRVFKICPGTPHMMYAHPLMSFDHRALAQFTVNLTIEAFLLNTTVNGWFGYASCSHSIKPVWSGRKSFQELLCVILSSFIYLWVRFNHWKTIFIGNDFFQSLIITSTLGPIDWAKRSLSFNLKAFDTPSTRELNPNGRPTRFSLLNLVTDYALRVVSRLLKNGDCDKNHRYVIRL